MDPAPRSFCTALVQSSPLTSSTNTIFTFPFSGNSKEEAAALAQFINESLAQAGADPISTQALEEAVRQAKREAAARGRPKRGHRGSQQQQRQLGLVEGVSDADQGQEPPQLPEAAQREREERERELQAHPLQVRLSMVSGVALWGFQKEGQLPEAAPQRMGRAWQAQLLQVLRWYGGAPQGAGLRAAGGTLLWGPGLLLDIHAG